MSDEAKGPVSCCTECAHSGYPGGACPACMNTGHAHAEGEPCPDLMKEKSRAE